MGRIKNIKLHIVTDIKGKTHLIMITHLVRASRRRGFTLKNFTQQSNRQLSRPVPQGVPKEKAHLWLQPAERVPQHVTTGSELMMTKIVGATFWFWVLWRFKHDWKTLFYALRRFEGLGHSD